MPNAKARKRYFSIFVPAMAAYLCSIFGISHIIDKSAPATPLTYILALIPAMFVFLWLWSHVRYILEVDEFVRHIQIKSVLWGLLALMVATTAWGILEIYTDVPDVPIFYVLPGFYLFYGIAAMIIGKAHNAGCEVL